MGLVLFVAGVAKLARPRATRESLRAFGVPHRLLLPGAFLLPAVELGVAGLLVPQSTARAGALAAAALLLVFTMALARALYRGEQPECNCFGALRSGPVDRWTLARNLTLIAVAATLGATSPGRLHVSLSTTQTLVLIVGTVMLVFTAVHVFFSVHLFRQNGRLLERVAALESGGRPAYPAEGLPAGVPAPRFDLVDLTGERQSLDSLLGSGASLALAFVDPDCGACGSALTQLAAIRERRSGRLAVAIVTRGDAEEARRKINGYEFDAVLLQDEREVADAFGVTRVPSVQIVAPDGRTASPLAIGGEAIGRLLDKPSSRDAHPSGAPA